MSQFTRRHLLVTSAAFASAAALNPFPKIVSPSRAAAQELTPAPAESQVIRWVGPGTRALSIPVYDDFWWTNLQSVYMTPFVQDTSGEISPGICADYTVSDDQLIYTFTMNPSAVWSDGSKITASDIKYTWDWMANPKLSGNPFNYYQTQAVKGNREVFAGSASEMSGLVVLDDDTLQITLSQPYTPFIYYCTHCLLGVHQKKNIEEGGPDWDKRPTVASGPFMVETFDVNEGSLTLVRNPHWWGQQPIIERLEYRAMPDPNARLLAWNNDEIEVIAGGASSDFLRQYGDGEVAKDPIAGNSFLLFNVQIEPLSDLHLRRALQRATDTVTLVKAVWETYWPPATSIVAPGDPAYIDRPFLFDVEAAKAELAQSSYKSGDAVPPIVMVARGADQVKYGTILQQMWHDALGVQLQVVPTDQPYPGGVTNGSVSVGQNVVLYLGPGGLLSWGWHKDNYWFTDHIKTVDEDVEALLNQGDQIADANVADRAAAYKAAEDLILDRAYTMPICWDVIALPTKKRVAQASMNPSAIFNLATSYIGVES
jgi:peptide/nickel transport system substrate-binding protein